MGNNMSVTYTERLQHIKERLSHYLPFANGGGNHDRKRRAEQSEDFNVLPTKSRKVDQIFKEHSEYSDHDMDEFDVEERKKELRKKNQRDGRSTILNGFPKVSNPVASNSTSFFLSNAPISVGMPFYLVNASNLGTPVASSSLQQPSLPALHPITKTRKPVPAALPIGLPNGMGYRSSTPFGEMSRGKYLAHLATTSRQKASEVSIFDKIKRDDSKKEYMALLQKVIPTIYKSNNNASTLSTDERKSTETQTELVDLTTSEGTSAATKAAVMVDLTEEKPSRDEEVSALMLKLNCKSAYTTKTENLREILQEKRRDYDRKIAEAEADLQLCQQDTEKYQKKVRKRILDTPEPLESTAYYLDKSDDEEEEKFVYPVLTKAHADQIKRAVSGGSGAEVIINKFNMSITRNDLNTLIGMTWLNDEVINFYMNLLMQRSDQNPEDLPRAYCFNTFFIPTVMSRGHAGVKRWTRKVDIFSYDLIPVPVHVGKIHWCMAVIRVQEKIIRYYDSMGNPNQAVLDALEQYLIDEAYDKKKQILDTSDWKKENVTDCPHQTNGSDCGVFSCMFAEHLTRNSGFTFTQSEMPYFRHKMIYEISTGQLLT